MHFIIKERIMIRNLNEKDITIINSISTEYKTVADVGAGDCVLSYYLSQRGYFVTAFDIYKNSKLKEYPEHSFEFVEKNIFHLTNELFDVVICSQVLEHIKEWQNAFDKLLKITKHKLILTVPWKKSFLDPGHINFWNDEKNKIFLDINDFKTLSKSNKFAVKKFYTKSADRRTGQMDYLIEVEKLESTSSN